MDASQQALEIVARIAGRPAAELNPRQDLVGDLGIDSPKALQLLVEMEESLGIEISDEEAVRMETVGDILSYLRKAERG